MDLTKLTIKECHEGLKKGDFTSVDLTRMFLDKIAENDDLNAYLSVDENYAIAQAEKADEKIKNKDFGMLCGIPCSIKDAIMVQGQKCTAASKILRNYVAVYDATVIEKLKKEGAVILGKTNLDEFTMGTTGENSAFGPTKNPHDKTRVPGGSSSGSAASVAADMAVFSLGSDTGGSIRLPASFCGIVGLCPTYGSVSRYGLIAHASSFDQIGPLAKNVEDAEAVFEIISGRDIQDTTSTDYKFEPSDKKLKGLKIGVPKEYFVEGMDEGVEEIIKNTIQKVKNEGAEIIDISLPTTEYALACYYILVPSEASANLARFDGIRYGLSESSENLLNVYLKSKGRGFGLEPKIRILTGTYCLSSGYYDAYYKKAQEVRQLIKQDFAKTFEKVDLIFCPVSPFLPFKIGEKVDDPLSLYLADILTVGIKLAGLPGLSLPVGKVGKLPVGLQIIGNYFEENKILSVAKEVEKIFSY